MTILLIIAHVGGGLVIGALLMGVWMERRHECLPHDPNYCTKYTLFGENDTKKFSE